MPCAWQVLNCTRRFEKKILLEISESPASNIGGRQLAKRAYSRQNKVHMRGIGNALPICGIEFYLCLSGAGSGTLQGT